MNIDRADVPRLKGMLPQSVIRARQFRVAGMPESDLDQLIAPIYTRYKNPVTTILSKGRPSFFAVPCMMRILA